MKNPLTLRIHREEQDVDDRRNVGMMRMIKIINPAWSSHAADPVFLMFRLLREFCNSLYSFRPRRALM
jgi:hypothetical protein